MCLPPGPLGRVMSSRHTGMVVLPHGFGWLLPCGSALLQPGVSAVALPSQWPSACPPSSGSMGHWFWPLKYRWVCCTWTCQGLPWGCQGGWCGMREATCNVRPCSSTGAEAWKPAALPLELALWAFYGSGKLDDL